KGRNADEIGQRRLVAAQLTGDERAQRGILHRTGRLVAGAHQEGGPAVLALARAHRADDRQVLAEGGDARQVLTDTQPRGAGLDLLEGAAVGVPGLEVEG